MPGFNLGEPYWVTVAREFVSQCSYPGYTFDVITSKTTKAVYLQGRYDEMDTLDHRIVNEQMTRRWLLSPEMSKSEIVSTVFKCVITSMEHRVREWFLYNGRAVFQPHYDVDELHKICLARVER